MTMQKIRLCGLLFVCLGLMMSSTTAQTAKNRKYAPDPEAPSHGFHAAQEAGTETAATAMNTFGLKLLADVAAHQRHENVFLSPLSLFAALAMTENGAAGKTRDAMR